MQSDSKRKPNVLKSESNLSGVAWREAAAIEVSVKCLFAVVRIADLERRLMFHAGKSSIIKIFFKAWIY